MFEFLTQNYVFMGLFGLIMHYARLVSLVNDKSIHAVKLSTFWRKRPAKAVLAIGNAFLGIMLIRLMEPFAIQELGEAFGRGIIGLLCFGACYAGGSTADLVGSAFRKTVGALFDRLNGIFR